jgi:hypothetical protein
MNSRSMAALILVLVVSACSVPRCGATERDVQLRAQSALLDRFETVFFAKSEILSTATANGQLYEGDSSRLRTPFAYLIRALNSLDNSASNEILRRSEAVLVGAKDFRAPAGLGAVHAKLCYVLLLRTGSGLDSRRYFNKSSPTTVSGINIWNWSADIGEFGEGDRRSSSVFATQVADSYLVVANDIKDLTEIVGQLNSAKNISGSSDSMRGLDSVRQHELWGYRHYRHDEIVDRTAAGMADVTPGTEALYFYVDVADKKAVLGILGSAGGAGTIKNINLADFLPALEERGAGTWESTISLAGNEKSYAQVFGVMGLFGFAIYL